MVGFKKVEKCESPSTDTPKYKRKNLFSRLGQRISRAFHRTHHDSASKRINKHQHSHSTGDLINDVQSSSSSHQPTTVAHERLQDHSEPRNSSIGAEDRSSSVGHIHGACRSGPLSSSSDRSNPAFLPSGFRDELNSKLRLRTGNDGSSFRARAGTKSADSCTSLASNDSLSCTTNTTSPVLSGDSVAASMTPSTHESHPSALTSPFSPASFNLVGVQHKLAASRQRKRRPPTRTESADGGDTESEIQSGVLTPLNMGCTHFFASPSTTIPLPFSHSPMDLISEEGAEADPKSAHTPASLNNTRKPLMDAGQTETNSPTPMPRPSLKSALRPENDPYEPHFSKAVPAHRPVSMYVAPSHSTPMQTEHQRFSPGSQTDTERTQWVHGPKKPPRLKSQSTSEQSHSSDSPNSPTRTELTVNVHFDPNSFAETKTVCDQHSGSRTSMDRDYSCEHYSPTPLKANSSISPTDMPPQKMSLVDPTPTAKPRTKLSATHKIRPTPVTNGEAAEQTPVEVTAKPTYSSVRPVSMFVPNAPEEAQSPHSSVSGSVTMGSHSSLETSRSKSYSTSHDDTREEDVAPERTSVADRAALFGAKLRSKKPSQNATSTALSMDQSNEVKELNPTSNARPVSVFNLVRNFEQTQ